MSFRVDAGEILGLVGESGSGKTMASLAIMGLLPQGIELHSGSVRLEGRELVNDDGEIHRTASEMSMIFQQPRSALNPTMKVGKQVSRVLQISQGLGKAEAKKMAVETLRRVGISGSDRVARAYPHQISGGMAQRVMISMALACRPRLLIADEPTTALDVTIQAQIFDLIKDLVSEIGCGVVFITHDLGAVAEMCDRVAVMYGGQVMEAAAKEAVLRNPQHPYTGYLLEALERDVDHRVEDTGVIFAIKGCRFAHRCPNVFSPCNDFPPTVEVEPGHESACFLHLEAQVGAP